MKFEDKNYFIIDKKKYEDVLKEDQENVYLYHFIYVKYMEADTMKFIKIDDVKDLKKIEGKNVLIKYYVEKIHYFNDCENESFEYGEPYFIFNIGYFYIGGFINNKEEETKKVKNLFNKYKKNYPKIHFPFNDIEYLSLNK